jgi:hypothetical protein
LSSHHNHHEEEDDEYDYTRSKSVIKIKTNENEYHQHHPAIIRPATNTDPISVIRPPINQDYDEYDYTRSKSNYADVIRSKSVIKIKTNENEYHQHHPAIIRPATNTDPISVIRAPVDSVPVIRPPTNTGNESRGKSVVKINNLRPGLKFSILQKPRLVEEEQDSGLSVIRPATNTPSFQQTSVIREAENVPIIRPRIVDAFE